MRFAIAAIAAIHPDVAERAAELIRVEYEQLPSVFTPESALAPDSPIIQN